MELHDGAHCVSAGVINNDAPSSLDMTLTGRLQSSDGSGKAA